jgi:hypothetical protein
MTRAVGQLMRGDLTAAMTFHPLVVPMMALGLGAWVWYLLWRLGRVGPVGHKLVQMTVAVSFGALVLVWALRLGSGGLPPV